MTRPSLWCLVNIIVGHNHPLRLGLARSNIGDMVTALDRYRSSGVESIPAAFRRRADADGTHRPVAALIEASAVEFLDLLVLDPLVVQQYPLAR
jgi:hypothetical protein